MYKCDMNNLIKTLRANYEIQKEDFVEDICDVRTLFRIEKGSVNMNDYITEGLLDRLNQYKSIYNIEDDKEDAAIKLLKGEIILNIFSGDMKAMKINYHSLNEILIKKGIYNQMEMEGDKNYKKLDFQFIKFIEILLSDEYIANYEKRCNELEKILSITIPLEVVIDPNKMDKYFYIIAEILIILEISKSYMMMKKYDDALEYLKPLSKNVFNCFDTSSFIIYPRVIISVVCCSISECLLNLKEYEKCIEILDRGIQWDRQCSKSKFLVIMLFNKLMCLYNMGNKDEVLELLPQVYYLALALKEEGIVSEIKNVCKNIEYMEEVVCF